MPLFDYSRASRLMDEHGIDLVLASSRPNVGYLAGYWHNVWDDYYLLWDPHVSHKTLAGIPKEPMDLAAQAIIEKGLGAGCIAVEMRYLGVSYFERLRKPYRGGDPEPVSL